MTEDEQVADVAAPASRCEAPGPVRAEPAV
jgi:hypothetical protein